ncbi:hypothetical protein [Microbacterium rhizosphaerae]|uniref:Uncharacterized protein n=1 Tax=Microbacterium rhizosphaerae TaxID=1678237 RepID=A0ABZ0SVN2_9MICO|nr:hypothetical protein [Microbacterium rhizosphaerae]WPR91297.1 hypothetical protein SM116_08470 [Microbacterium rhizosphaerae]
METDESARCAAEHVSAALNDLAHSTITVEDPASLYPILGELLCSVRSLVQVTDQLAHAHLRLRQHARSEDGDVSLGGRESDSAAWALVRARELLEAAEGQVDEASQRCGHVAWVPAERTERWVNVVFLDKAEATEALQLIDRFGAAVVIRQLSRLDRGDESTEDALVNGYVYDTIPTSPTDRVALDPQSGYAITFNPTLGYVSLHRRYEPDAAAAQPQHAPGTPPAASPVPAWFCSPPRAHREHGRSVAL